MQPLVRSLPVAAVVPSLVGATVVAFAAGSSSVAAANEAGKPLRWVMLVVLLAASAAWAAQAGLGVPLARPVVLAAGALLVVALASSLWSVDPGLTAARALSLVLLFAVAAFLAVATAGRPDGIRRVLAGLLGGATVVAVAGLIALAADHAAAVQSATYDAPWRFRGFGENPNTVPLLLALALPVAVWFGVSSRRVASRLVVAGLLVLFAGSIGASGSRGALVAGFAGAFLVAVLSPASFRVRVALATAVIVLSVASLAAGKIAEPTGKPLPPAPSATNAAGYIDAEKAMPLSFEVGTGLVSGVEVAPRGLFGSSGRSVAWRGALDTALERPALGYGFGSEAKVFVDRYAAFEGGLTENSYLGLGLQLGVVGVLAFAGLVAAILAVGLRALARPEAVVCSAVFVVGLLQALGQSYLFSVGNIATAAFWICAFLVVAAAVPLRVRP